MREQRESPSFTKTAKDGASFFNQGFTQKHPLLLHLRTNPGMQRITELGGEIVDFLAFCVWAFDAMIGVHTRAAAMMNLLKLSIFIKSFPFFDRAFARCG
jgi:hypothetical protein